MMDFFNGLSISDIILAREYSDILKGMNLELARRNYSQIAQTPGQNTVASLALFKAMVNGLSSMSASISGVGANRALKKNMTDMIANIQTLSKKLVNTTTGI